MQGSAPVPDATAWRKGGLGGAAGAAAVAGADAGANRERFP